MTDDFPLPYASTDLTGEVALVTGATSGLGPPVRSHARRRRRVGGGVRPPGRSPRGGGGARSPPPAGQAVAVPLDVSDAEAIPAAVDQAEAAFGLVTILVNNAGIPDAQRAHKMSLELIDQVLDTNVRAPYVLSCEVARRLIAAKRPGRIVNISSNGAFHYDGGGAALYSVSKAAVNRMTEALAVEWSRNRINVNAIAPGRVPVRDDGRDDVPRSATSPPRCPASASANRRSSTARSSTSWRRPRSASPAPSCASTTARAAADRSRRGSTVPG